MDLLIEGVTEENVEILNRKAKEVGEILGKELDLERFIKLLLFLNFSDFATEEERRDLDDSIYNLLISKEYKKPSKERK